MRTRPTKRAVVQTFLGLMLYGAGSNVSAGWVVVLAAVVLGAVPWAWFGARRAGRTLAVRRVLPRRAIAGLPTPVALEVRAETAAMAVVEDELTNTVGVAGELRTGASLAADTVLPRGSGIAGTVRARLSDPMGLVTVTCEGRVGSDVEVVPAIPDVRGLDVHAAWAVEAGEESQRAGDGTEVLGVREYRPGDAIRSVHWRSSARRGQLVVRELADHARPTIRVEVAAASWAVTTLDRAAEVACAVAQDAADAGYPVEVAVDGGVDPWSAAVRRRLAVVPPHAGAEARPLRPVPPGHADVVVHLSPVAGGVAVAVADGTTSSSLGVVPDDADLAAIEAWLALQVGGR